MKESERVRNLFRTTIQLTQTICLDTPKNQPQSPLHHSGILTGKSSVPHYKNFLDLLRPLDANE